MNLISVLCCQNKTEVGNVMITSTSSSQVRHVVSLQKKNKTRKEFKEYVVEGLRMVQEAPIEAVVKVYASESFNAANADVLSRFPKERTELVSDHVFLQMSDTKTPQGILAVMKMREWSLEQLVGGTPLIIAVENLQDPGNLGTILRMGEGAGITGVVMSSNTVDIYNPKTIRSTMGSVYRVPFVYTPDFVDTLHKLQSYNISVYAAHLNGTEDYTQSDYTKGTAFLIGNEGNGLSEAAAAAADTLVKIPMQGEVESYNAAIACTILTFEAVRQRRQ
jgi:TrmH family RNA methyltransferase